ncbi:MAG: HAMP domain-containing histidine kinase [Anaerolineae bacterium]|jgi:signal transduction histidine kinase|nr:HAMP domain-containing histidine kinase [Anaerolineae bacterium]
MIKINGHKTAAVTLLLITNTSPINYETELNNYYWGHAASLEEAKEFILEYQPDVVLAPPSLQTDQLFEVIRRNGNTPLRPLLITITDTPTHVVYADAQVMPDLLSFQLDPLIKLRAENIRFYYEQQLLQEEVTRLKNDLKAERRIKNELEILKNAIIRNVSHELNTPLLQVKSAVAMLKDKEKSDEQDQQLVEFAIGATTRLETLVKNITMLGGSLEYNPGPIILRDTVEAARRNLRRVWEHRDQTQRIKINLPNTLPPVLGDKQGITTVFQLLIDNALKFSKDEVTIDATVTSDTISVYVRDTGIGIAQDQLEAIFDLFYQVDSSSTRRYGGMGVGLAIVRLILDHHGSEIQVESQVGKGSLFSFHLSIIKL